MSTQRILIIEDEEVIRKSTGAILTHSGFEVIAVDGKNQTFLEQALTALQAQPIDFVLSDNNLAHVNQPEELGLEILRKIHREYPTLPLVLMSGRLQPEDLNPDEGIKFLPKPFDRMGLLTLFTQ